jgi:hypothetical protein
VTAATASARGRANREKGAVAERHLVGWLRTHGWPHADRAVRAGYRTADRTVTDPGDVTGTPNLVWQMKYTSRFEQPAFLTACLAETEQQRAAARADLGLLVQRRTGVSDPGRWWVWLHLVDVFRLHWLPELAPTIPAPTQDYLEVPVRMELADLVPLLHAAGYGTPAEVP